MVDTLCDSERQASLSSAACPSCQVWAVHSGLFFQVVCPTRRMPSSRVHCNAILARLLRRVMWPNRASFLLLSAPILTTCIKKTFPDEEQSQGFCVMSGRNPEIPDKMLCLHFYFSFFH